MYRSQLSLIRCAVASVLLLCVTHAEGEIGFDSSGQKVQLQKVASSSAKDPTISGVGGYGDGVGVVNGKWTGQGPACKNAKGKYYGFYACESVSSSSWTISGKNFGKTTGKASISDTSITSKVESWGDTSVKISVKVPYSYTCNTGVKLTLTTSDKKSASTTISTLGIIKSRGYGQCTWYVANQRLSQKKAIPTSAYTSNTIDWKYAPSRWDCLNYGGKHVGIIISEVTKKTAKDTTTYTFTVGEMNATCNEGASTYSATFAVGTKAKKITTNIGSNAGSTYKATGYYR